MFVYWKYSIYLEKIQTFVFKLKVQHIKKDMKTTLIYDGTFDGFLTAVYKVFDEQLKDVEIVKPKHFQPTIFVDSEEVKTNSEKAKRVWSGLQAKVSKSTAYRLYTCFLSEIKGVENVLLRFILFAYCSESFSYTNHNNKDVLRVLQVSKMVFRERDRMEAIVKFQLTKDGIYFASIEPDFNVLPLLLKHIEKKYPERQWILFDKKRRVGVHYKNGIISWINQEDYFRKTSRYIKKNTANTIFLDANHLRINRDDAFKPAV